MVVQLREAPFDKLRANGLPSPLDSCLRRNDVRGSGEVRGWIRRASRAEGGRGLPHPNLPPEGEGTPRCAALLEHQGVRIASGFLPAQERRGGAGGYD